MAVTDAESRACQNLHSCRGGSPASRGRQDNGWEQMTHLLNAASHMASQRPMVRLSIQVILAFCCAAPLVLLFSSVVGYGVHTLMH
jgi:hypothetical protein